MKTIRVREVAAKTGISVPSIWRLMKQENFPASFKLSPNVTVWDEAEIDTYLNQKKMESYNGNDRTRGPN